MPFKNEHINFLETLIFPRWASGSEKCTSVSHDCVESWSVQSCYQSTYERQKKRERQKGTVCGERCNCSIGPCLWQISFLNSTPPVVIEHIPVISKLAVGFVQINAMRICFPSQTSSLSLFVEISITAESFSVCKTHTSWAIFFFDHKKLPQQRGYTLTTSTTKVQSMIYGIHIKSKLNNCNNSVCIYIIFKYVIMLFKSDSSSYLIKLMAY